MTKRDGLTTEAVLHDEINRQEQRIHRLLEEKDRLRVALAKISATPLVLGEGTAGAYAQYVRAIAREALGWPNDTISEVTDATEGRR